MKAFIVMMSRIDAQERLAAVRAAPLSNNLVFTNQLDRERAMEALERKAAGAPPPVPVKADPADLAAMGIGLVAADGPLPEIASLSDWLGEARGDG